LESVQKADSNGTLFLKVFIAVFPASLFGRLLPHEHIAYVLILIVSVVLAGLIPPRKGFVRLLAITLIVVLAYLRFFA
jgi:hypothetical protein